MIVSFLNSLYKGHSSKIEIHLPNN